MTSTLKWQAAIALLLVFLAGVAIGVFGAVHRIHGAMFDRRAEHIRERMSEHLRRQLDLTPAQFEQLKPIIDRAANQLNTIRTETGRHVAETMRQSRDEIAPHLSAEQKAKLDRMAERHHRMMHAYGPPPPDGP